MIGRFLVLSIMALVLYACKKDKPTEPETGPDGPEKPDTTITAPPSAPNPVKAEAVNGGADLKLTWSSVENAERYAIYGDGVEVSITADTSTTLFGTSGVYTEVLVCARNSEGETCDTLDLSLWVGQAQNICDHLQAGCSSWVKIDFNGPSVSVIQQSDVDMSLPNTGYFILYDNNGNLELRDASATSAGQALMQLSFTENTTSSFAPPAGNYTTARSIVQGGRYIFWADNVPSGYGIIDTNDYFGIIRVDRLSNTDTDLTVYIQDKVKGLRWLKSP